MESIRTQDTIFSKEGEVFRVEEKNGRNIKARNQEKPRLLKTFNVEDLFCVDLDDGIWQETV